MNGLIEVQDVSKAFGGVWALSACSLAVPEGKIVGLIGPNGSGKTTLFNVITGYEHIQQGEVNFAGKNITNARPDLVFKLGIARTFQLARTFPQLSVLDNMLVATQSGKGWLRSMVQTRGDHRERKRAMEVLDFVGLSSVWQERAGELSYGQRRLLELGYVLVADPKVILLDEPTAGVNIRLVEQLAGKIRELNKEGKTFLIVEHNMEFVMGICDLVSVLHRGRTIVTGPPATVREDPLVLHAYLGSERG